MKIADISTYQGIVNWEQAKSELSFVILRASIGNTVDNKYNHNIDECERCGIPYHAYHFLKATSVESARSEARVFAKATEQSKPLFYVIDAEYSKISSSNARSIVEAFENELRKRIDDYIRVAVYIAHHLYRSWKLDYDRYAYVWIPRYGKDDGSVSNSRKPSYPCDLWQYTSKGKLKGVRGNVDLDIINSEKDVRYFTTNRTLRQGCKGREVTELQTRLMTLGYSLGDSGIDGHYGEKTTQAVKQFQETGGLTPDGVFGKLTSAQLETVLRARQFQC